jgi:quercetin dioxygenase-like cupin family protein
MRRVKCNNLEEAVDEFVNNLGYRLDMIIPADSPREVQLSKNGETVRLVSEPAAVASGLPQHSASSDPKEFLGQLQPPPIGAGSYRWTAGRAGMMYRDLMPDRMGGKMAVSHIRLTEGGEVPDYVHYHKIEFQMIRCIKGRIKVVYEDQGEPFWLEPGDWVIQPPEIRHRVLECEAGSEVIEVSMPAEHETWVDHEMTLPTTALRPDREFNGQRFVRFIAPK